ncbi:MAG: redoxin family protein [Bacteroidota bacterium]
MIKNLCLCVAALLWAGISYGQSAKRLFANTESIILKYKADCNKAWDAGNEKLANTYYDSINACIVGSYVGSHKFKTVDNKLITIAAQKPVMVTVSASWCAPCRAEIPALNKIVEEYKDKVDFVVLFWNDALRTKQLASLYSKSVFVVPSAIQVEGDESHKISIAGFNHFMGYPANYMINTSRKIVRYETGAQVATSFQGPDGKMVTITEEQADNFNYKRLKESVEFLLTNKGK